jgi:hypothetical protein
MTIRVSEASRSTFAPAKHRAAAVTVAALPGYASEYSPVGLARWFRKFEREPLVLVAEAQKRR